jgi:protein-disulfide isomerase
MRHIAYLQAVSVSAARSLLPAILGAAVLLAGCRRDRAVSGTSGTSAPGTSAPTEVLATVGDQKITLADIRDKAGEGLEQLDIEYARAKSNIIEKALDETLRERVVGAEAARQGKTVDELVIAEAGGTIEPSEIEISRWYNENQNRVGGRPLEQIRSQIAELLRNEKQRIAATKLERRLNAEKKVSIKFQPYRFKFENENAPSLGSAGAPVQVVEFSDFQCPFCRQFAPNVKEIQKQFGDKVRLVYRQFPIPSIHPFAFKAAEASLCANEQGKFWELHDLMFGDQGKLTIMDLKSKAGRIGVDQKRFDACLDQGKFTAQVQKDMNDGARAGVSGTPALFVNGVEVPGGAVPFSTISEAIERELSRSN